MFHDCKENEIARPLFFWGERGGGGGGGGKAVTKPAESNGYIANISLQAHQNLYRYKINILGHIMEMKIHRVFDLQ